MTRPMRHLEDQLQTAIANYLHAIRLDLVAVWFSVEVGGKRTKLQQARLKARGVKAGTPDMVILLPGLSIQLEVKVPKTGRMGLNQLKWQDNSAWVGVHYYVVRSIDDVKAVLEKRGVLDLIRRAKR